MSGDDTIITTAPARFDLRALAPARPTFTDEDGTAYPVRLPRDLNLVDRAEQYNALDQRRAMIQRLTERQGDVEAARIAAETLTRQVAILVPTLPAERLAAISDTDKLAFVSWWQEHFLVPTSGVAASGPTPTTTGDASAPDSAASTPATGSPTS